MKNESETEFSNNVCYGDFIYIEAALENNNGVNTAHLCSNGFYESDVSFISDPSLNKSFRNCIFQIIPAINYIKIAEAKERDKILHATYEELFNAQDKEMLKFFIESEGQSFDPAIYKAKIGLQKEQQGKNIAESFANFKGKPIKYGDKIQLFNVECQKFLKINRKAHFESTELNSLTLTENCSLTTAFTLVNNPLHFDHYHAEYKNDVQIISCYNKQSLVCGINSNIETYIQMKKSPVIEPKVPYEGFILPTVKRRKNAILDANKEYFAGTRAIANESFFKFRSFMSWKTFESNKTTQRIKNGDYVRIKNGNAYLTLNEINKYEAPFFSFNLEKDYSHHLINSIFQIIETDPNELHEGNGVTASNAEGKTSMKYFLKHLISGKLLQLPKKYHDDQENILEMSIKTSNEITNQYARLSFLLNYTHGSTTIELPLMYNVGVGIAFINHDKVCYIQNDSEKSWNPNSDFIDQKIYLGPFIPSKYSNHLSATQFYDMKILDSKSNVKVTAKNVFLQVDNAEIHKILNFESFANCLVEFVQELQNGIIVSEVYSRKFLEFEKVVTTFQENFETENIIEIHPDPINLAKSINDVLIREFNILDSIFNLLLITFDNNKLKDFVKNDLNNSEILKEDVFTKTLPEIIIKLLSIFLNVTQNSRYNAKYATIYTRLLFKIINENQVSMMNLFEERSKEKIKNVVNKIILSFIAEDNYEFLPQIIDSTFLYTHKT